MILKVENASFGYSRDNLILRDIDFELREGEIMAVLGPNGIGKTTLLKNIMGLLKWHSGRTYLCGREISAITSKELWKIVSYVPQAKNFFTTFSVLDMVVMGRAPYIGTFSSPSKEDVDMAVEAIEELGIAHLKDSFCCRVSGGQLQLALIARALVSNPRIVILDEPESHLDFRNQLLVLEKLSQISRGKNISCIINTHYPENALKIADKTLMLGNGKYVFGDTRDIINEQALCDYFDVIVRILPFSYNGKRYSTISALRLRGNSPVPCDAKHPRPWISPSLRRTPPTNARQKAEITL
ncbi:MAG: ABC transporter ATP-binding protein [Synergistaceae bacterium]|nr:ABC transporter ATP-binding protein [Synergistaceae bacterium]